jgi:uncharacterized membrane protein YkvI
MSEKKSLLVDKSKMPLAMGLAFVAFTTQFGGGFASGAQIYQYFINYGIWCLILPLVTQGLICTVFLVWHALCIQTQNIRLQKFFRQPVW